MRLLFPGSAARALREATSSTGFTFVSWFPWFICKWGGGEGEGGQSKKSHVNQHHEHHQAMQRINKHAPLYDSVRGRRRDSVLRRGLCQMCAHTQNETAPLLARNPRSRWVDTPSKRVTLVKADFPPLDFALHCIDTLPMFVVIMRVVVILSAGAMD
jgi:hypothetical protein